MARKHGKLAAEAAQEDRCHAARCWTHAQQVSSLCFWQTCTEVLGAGEQLIYLPCCIYASCYEGDLEGAHLRSKSRDWLLQDGGGGVPGLEGGCAMAGRCTAKSRPLLPPHAEPQQEQGLCQVAEERPGPP